MSISMAAAGRERSKVVMTSGCKTPNRPITFSLTTTSAHSPGKKLESEGEGGGRRGRGGGGRKGTTSLTTTYKQTSSMKLYNTQLH